MAQAVLRGSSRVVARRTTRRAVSAHAVPHSHRPAAGAGYPQVRRASGGALRSGAMLCRRFRPVRWSGPRALAPWRALVVRVVPPGRSGGPDRVCSSVREGHVNRDHARDKRVRRIEPGLEGGSIHALRSRLLAPAPTDRPGGRVAGVSAQRRRGPRPSPLARRAQAPGGPSPPPPARSAAHSGAQQDASPRAMVSVPGPPADAASVAPRAGA
jgi:hypothetical protein